MTDLTTVKFTAHDLKSLTEREVIVRIPKGIVVDYSPFNDESFLSQAKTLKKKEFETKPPIKWSGKDSTAKLLTLTNGDLELWICRKRFELTLSPEGWYQTKQKEDKKSIICNSGDVSDARSNVLNERNKFQRKIKEKSKNYTNVLTRNFLETVSDDESEDTKKLLALKKGHIDDE
ncbi:Uncharacterized protein QTN25_006015 [Entamoeba marina]